MAELIKAAEYEEANRERLEEEARMLEQLEKELGKRENLQHEFFIVFNKFLTKWDFYGHISS